MANENSTGQDNATPEQLAKQYPDNCDPFGIWYFINAECRPYKWVVNDENGDAFTETINHKAALIISDALRMRHQKISNKEIILDIEQQKEVNYALLIGLESFGEIERIIDELKGFDIASTVQIPELVRPIHPTGSNDTISTFATALRFMQQTY